MCSFTSDFVVDCSKRAYSCEEGRHAPSALNRNVFHGTGQRPKSLPTAQYRCNKIHSGTVCIFAP
eukprot:1232774-Amphidinium_carterae.2